MFSECRMIASEFGGDVTGSLIAEDFPSCAEDLRHVTRRSEESEA